MSEREPTEDDFVFLTPAEAECPPESMGLFFIHYVSYWWAVHPDKGLAFYNPVVQKNGRRKINNLGHPQHNTIESVVRGVVIPALPFEAEARLIPSAWSPINLSDYRL